MTLRRAPSSILAKQWKAVVLFGLAASVLSLVISLFFPLEYRADADVLIIAKSRFGVDPYTVVKSAERVGENLVQIIGTDDFYAKVIDEAPSRVDQEAFEALSPRKRRREWQRLVAPSVVYGTGVLTVSTYATEPARAEGLASAVVDTLARRGWEYVGGDVTIRVVNSPVVTEYPVRPNLVLNVLAAFIAGSILMTLLLIRRG